MDSTDNTLQIWESRALFLKQIHETWDTHQVFNSIQSSIDSRGRSQWMAEPTSEKTLA